MMATSAITEALGRQLDRIVDPVETAATGSTCEAPWSFYCRHMSAAVRYAIDRGKAVLVVGQPLLRYGQEERHASQQRALADMLEREFRDARVRYVNLAEAVDLSDSRVAYDGLHLTAEANRIVAARLVEPIRHLVEQSRPSF